ncbi:MAG: hypothetical protein KF813_06775 [Trueperaceae bacterium]|nr:hypothetical protein [Trueperaceae bacterium]
MTSAAAQPVPYSGVPGGAPWASGSFAAAYQEAVEVDSVAAKLLAARAAADQAVYLETDAAQALAWLAKSEAAAAAAVALDPNGPLAAMATMALARAKGEAARHRGLLENTRLPGEMRELFERVLALDPDNADALIAFGAWHLELTERGVGWLYGGRKDQVLPLFERGVAAAPEQLNLRVEYAVALQTLGRAAEAEEQLRIALALPAVTAADRLEQSRARRLLP